MQYKNPGLRLTGSRFTLDQTSMLFPEALKNIPKPPIRLYGIGNPYALQEGLSIVGARKATPYGISCAKRFARLAAMKGVGVISGGAYGCDAAAHQAVVDVKGKGIVFLGGGCDFIYPKRNFNLFQEIIDLGGAIISEHEWEYPALPATFLARNRLIAGLARATLIVEAGIPSGTFSTADEALRAGKEVWVVPGAITSPNSLGCNRLLYQGAIPVVDNDSFEDLLFAQFGSLKQEDRTSSANLVEIDSAKHFDILFQDAYAALRAQPLSTEELITITAKKCSLDIARDVVYKSIVMGEQNDILVQYPNGKWSYNIPTS